MVTIENMGEHLKNNPDEREVLDEQLRYFFPIWLGDKNKQRLIKSLPDKDMEFLFQAILISSISKKDIAHVEADPEYQKILNMFNQVKDGENELLLHLSKIYFDNLTVEALNYEHKIRDFVYKKMPKSKKEQVDTLEANRKTDIAQKVIDDYYKSHENECFNLKKQLDLLKSNADLLNIAVFSSEALKCNPDKIEYISYAVYKPMFLTSTILDEILSNSEKIPCGWYLYGTLSISEYKEFVENNTDTAFWSKQYKYAISNILRQLDVPVLGIKQRKHLIKDIIANINETRVDSALIIMFSVIEGLLWELTKEVNKVEKIYVSEKVVYDCDNNCNFETNRIRDILERTYIKRYLDDDFLQYFCNELYEERNPVLHGGQICKECPNQGICIIRKIFTVDYILSKLIEVYQQNLFKMWDDSFSEEKINEFIEICFDKTI